jgi:Bacterial protein of unknown function (DUF899)
VFRTYFVNNRGDEAMGSTWSYLDLTALGRQEYWEDSPPGYPQTPPYGWWNWHDECGDADPPGGEATRLALDPSPHARPVSRTRLRATNSVVPPARPPRRPARPRCG